jgi:DNA polymerase
VDRWRQANKQVVQFWYDTQKAAIEALDKRGVVKGAKGLKFFYKKGFLFIKLPSGRKLAYAKARLEEGKYGPQMVYDGKGDKVGFSKLQTYGGKLVENIVQATARDLLAEAMLRLDEAGYAIVFHVHDEAVAEVPKDSDQTIDDMNDLMAICPGWAAGLPLGAEGFVTDYYKKD